MSFEILRPGILSLVQDYGRHGYAYRGYATSGALDEHAFLWANKLLGNAATAATVEITLGRAELRAQVNTNIAVCGADLNFFLDGQPAPLWQTLPVRAGQHLQWHNARSGMRAYLGVSGGFHTPAVMGSRSQCLRENPAGALKPGDVLPCSPYPACGARLVPAAYIPDYDADNQPIILSLLPVSQFNCFDEGAKRRFFASEYAIMPSSNRTACLLKGEVIAVAETTMPSEGMVCGAVQITFAGQPMIMLKDHPTIGGYPKMGTVFALDLCLLAQCRPGCRVRFQPMDMDAARRKRIEFMSFFGLL